MAPPNEEQPNRAAERIEELETRLAQQDQAILELSDELYRQQRQVARLEAELRQLVERMKTINTPDPGAGPADDEVPPHY